MPLNADKTRTQVSLKYSTLDHLRNLLSLIFDEAERLELLVDGKPFPLGRLYERV
jgi:hypothetical protein